MTGLHVQLYLPVCTVWLASSWVCSWACGWVYTCWAWPWDGFMDGFLGEDAVMELWCFA